MNLAALEKFDHTTASGVLAAAALASAANVAGTEPDIVNKYKFEAQQVLSEIRSRLHIVHDDNSSAARISISNFLTKQIEDTVLGGADITKILARAGNAGRLHPALYSVRYAEEFLELFTTLGIRKNNVEDAVTHPDDYQHLMTEYAAPHVRDLVSLFMKEVKTAKTGNDHWLLVQTFRDGLTQVPQSAWRVFPGDVDLKGALEPLHVLKAFVNTFGFPVQIEGREALFVESLRVKKGERMQLVFDGHRDGAFVSMSKIESIDPEIVLIGTAFGIDTLKYRDSLVKHGIVSAQAPRPIVGRPIHPGDFRSLLAAAVRKQKPAGQT